jgi:hypothetical protein
MSTITKISFDGPTIICLYNDCTLRETTDLKQFSAITLPVPVTPYFVGGISFGRIVFVKNEKLFIFNTGDIICVDHHFAFVRDIRCDWKGRIYVCDIGLRRVDLFNEKGIHLRQICIDEWFNAPTEIFIDREHQQIITAHNSMYQVWDITGARLIRTFTMKGYCRIKDIIHLRECNLCLCQRGHIHKYSATYKPTNHKLKLMRITWAVRSMCMHNQFIYIMINTIVCKISVHVLQRLFVRPRTYEIPARNLIRVC